MCSIVRLGQGRLWAVSTWTNSRNPSESAAIITPSADSSTIQSATMFHDHTDDGPHILQQRGKKTQKPLIKSNKSPRNSSSYFWLNLDFSIIQSLFGFVKGGLKKITSLYLCLVKLKDMTCMFICWQALCEVYERPRKSVSLDLDLGWVINSERFRTVLWYKQLKVS